MLRRAATFALLVLLAGGSSLRFLRAESSSGSAPEAPEPAGTIVYLRTIDSTSIRSFRQPRSLWGKLVAWVAGPAEVPQLLRPYGLTEDNLGRLIVTDPGLGVVHIFDFERRRHDILQGTRQEPLVSPIGVAVDAGNNIYVSDSVRARILVFNAQGKLLRALGGGKDKVVLMRPTGLALDPARKILYVTDTLRHQVLLLGLEGQLLKVIGERGSAAGEFNFPTALTLAGGLLYVVDAMNFRIQIFTQEGEFVRHFGELGNQSGTMNRPKGVAVDSDGNLYVVDALFETVQIFDREGRLLYFFGSTGNGAGQFGLPSGIYIAPRDRIYVTDSLNQRVHIFRYRRNRNVRP